MYQVAATRSNARLLYYLCIPLFGVLWRAGRKITDGEPQGLHDLRASNKSANNDND